MPETSTCPMPRSNFRTCTNVLSKSGRPNVLFLDAVRIDPDFMLLFETITKYIHLLHKYDDAFNPHFSYYNRAVGPLEAKINMDPVSPPQKENQSFKVFK